MRILYGIPSEGMGHVIRSCVVIDYLAKQKYVVAIVSSGKAFTYLDKRYRNNKQVILLEIGGFHLVFNENKLKKRVSILSNLKLLQEISKKSKDTYETVKKMDLNFDLAISDFESWSFFYAKKNKIPVISLDNIQFYSRVQHDWKAIKQDRLSKTLQKLVNKIKVPNADYYFISSFVNLPVKKKHTFLIPPVLRDEVLRLKPTKKSHILVYQSMSSNQDLPNALNKINEKFKVYGMGELPSTSNVEYKAFSEKTFLKDLASAKAVITGGGFTLITEALYLKKPILSIPIEQHPEQMLNAYYLNKFNYGRNAVRYDFKTIKSFVDEISYLENFVAKYPSHDNTEMFAYLDLLLKQLASNATNKSQSLKRSKT